MKIIEPKVELWQQGNDSKAHVARCARVCYGRYFSICLLQQHDINNIDLIKLDIIYNIQ